MQCARIVKLLSEYLDGELDTEQANMVKVHLSGCKRCAIEFQALRGVTERLDSLGNVPPPEDFLEGVHCRLEEGFGIRRFLHTLFIPPKIKIPFECAGVLIVAVLIIFILRSPEMRKVGERMPGQATDKEITEFRKQEHEVTAQKEKRIVPEERDQALDVLPSSKSPDVLLNKGLPLPTVAEESKSDIRPGKKKPIMLALLLKPARRQEMKAFVSERYSKKQMLDKEQIPLASQAPRAGQVTDKEEAVELKDWEEGQKRMMRDELFAKTEKEPVPSAPDASSSITPLFESLDEVIPRVVSSLERLQGRYISTGYDQEEISRPKYIIGEVPAVNYPAFLKDLAQLGILKEPLQNGPADSDRMLQVQIELIIFH